jgi:hypothetical protein
MEPMRLYRDPDCPQPEDSVIDYDAKNLETRVSYARTLKRRKFTPRTEAFASGYLEIAEEALSAEQDDTLSEEAKTEFKLKVLKLDTYLQCHESLWYIPSSTMKQLAEQATLLAKFSLYARYGQYMSIELNQVKEATCKLEDLKAHRTIFLQYWTTIQEKIESEQQMDKSDRILGSRTTINAVRSCALAMGIPDDQLFWTIKEFASRNGLLHADLERMVALGKCAPLAQRIYQDLLYIRALKCPGSDNDFLKYLGIIVEKLRDEWFKFREEADKDDPETWQLSKRAQSLRTPKGGKPTTAILEFNDHLKAIATSDFEATMENSAGLKSAMVDKSRLISGEISNTTEAEKRAKLVENALAQHSALLKESPRYKELQRLLEDLTRFEEDFPPAES